jgi:acetolactate synthase-1/2/3 large subunit
LGINGKPVININFVKSNFDYVYSPYLDVIGDIGNTFWQLCESEIDSSRWDFSEINKINEVNKKKIKDNLALEDDIPYMMPRRLAKELREVLAADDILTLDN